MTARRRQSVAHTHRSGYELFSRFTFGRISVQLLYFYLTNLCAVNVLPLIETNTRSCAFSPQQYILTAARRRYQRHTITWGGGQYYIV